ncbi:hypothetical protein Cni_G26841 [Canna indica]|uniref:SUN domain-containing protein n=1 Tax=Canna indica TaxID=4628 RepID=A0AAQ3KZP5_9LILI|nr:hypothetical protein Cni_G26841 [Canna indica]
MSAPNAAVRYPETTQDARRRIVVKEKKSSSGTLKGGGTYGDTAGNVNDFHHKTRGQSFVERSKHMEEVKRGFVASALGSRHKKGTSKSEKAKWPFFLSILTRLCLLLVGVLWLGLLVWRWKDMIKYSKGFSSLDSEGRLLDLEESLKSSAKRLQNQLDVVDRKIGTEVGITKRELKKQVEEKDLLFKEGLRRLTSQTDKLDRSVAEMKGMGLLSKEELQNFLNGFKERSLGGNDYEFTLDDIRKLAKEIVEKEIEKHAADGLGWIDYALASGGARVISHSEPYLVGKSRHWLALGKGRNRVHPNAQRMLEPSFGEPGKCFALQGNNGFIKIRLKTGIIPEAVTLEHVPKSVAYDRSSALKDCTVSAWFEEPGSNPTILPEKIFILTEFSYDLEKSNAQTFKVDTTVSGLINTVQLDFSTNHGSSTLTCIYRFRVHGYEPNSSMNVAAQG